MHAPNSLKSNTPKTFTHEKADERETEWFNAVQPEVFLMKVYLLSRAEGLLLHSRSEAAMQIIINTLHFSSTLYLRSALQARTARSLTVSGRHEKKQEQPLYPRQK